MVRVPPLLFLLSFRTHHEASRSMVTMDLHWRTLERIYLLASHCSRLDTRRFVPAGREKDQAQCMLWGLALDDFNAQSFISFYSAKTKTFNAPTIEVKVRSAEA
jgi:hypothetical protein